MNDLEGLQKFLVLHNVKIKESNGWYFITETGDRWTMALDLFYRNNEPVTEKDIVAGYKKKK